MVASYENTCVRAICIDNFYVIGICIRCFNIKCANTRDIYIKYTFIVSIELKT